LWYRYIGAWRKRRDGTNVYTWEGGREGGRERGRERERL
jgi:hypothetical protein